MAVAIALLGLLVAYTGCSGRDYETGYFIDDPVDGLYFITATQSGYTNADGAFRYKEGEIVSFYVGDILVGEAAGAAEITPFDLAGTTPPLTNIEVVRIINQMQQNNWISSIDMAVNIAVFLQTLDADGIYSNGIQIPDQVLAASHQHIMALGVFGQTAATGQGGDDKNGTIFWYDGITHCCLCLAQSQCPRNTLLP